MIPWRRKWQPSPVLLPWKSHGRRSLVQATIHGVAKSRAQLSDFTLLSQEGAPSLPLLSLFLSFVFFPTSFWRQWAAFLGAWCPLPAIRIVLWNLLSVQMFFWWIYGGESGLHIVFLCHVRTAPAFEILAFSIYIFSPQNDVCKNVILKIFL